MKLVYRNGSTGAESVVEVELLPAGKYREGITGYRAISDHTPLGAIQPHKILGFLYDESTVLEGRAGLAHVITDEEATRLLDAAKAEIARQQAKQPVSFQHDPTRCWECGLPHSGRTLCPHCGADPLEA
jgi:hypothetical protein